MEAPFGAYEKTCDPFTSMWDCPLTSIGLKVPIGFSALRKKTLTGPEKASSQRRIFLPLSRNRGQGSFA